MHRTFSIATLLLVVAIVGVALASIRGVVARVSAETPSEVMIPVIAGGIAGAIFGLVLTAWQRSRRSLWNPMTWLRAVGNLAGGCLLGAGAGAQLVLAVNWWIIALVPLLIVGGTAIVARDRRREFARLRGRTRSIERSEVTMRDGPVALDEPG